MCRNYCSVKLFAADLENNFLRFKTMKNCAGKLIKNSDFPFFNRFICCIPQLLFSWNIGHWIGKQLFEQWNTEKLCRQACKKDSFAFWNRLIKIGLELRVQNSAGLNNCSQNNTIFLDIKLCTRKVTENFTENSSEVHLLILCCSACWSVKRRY